MGAAIAPLTASRSEEIAFIVLLGGYGLIGTQTGVITRKYLGQRLGETEKESEKGIRLVERIFQIILSEEGWNEVNSLIHEEMKNNFTNLSKEQQSVFETVDNYLTFTYEGFLLSEGSTPMYRFFLDYNPSSSLLKTTCPVLLLFGELDVIHPPDHHMDNMVQALKNGGNNNINIEVFPQTDHEFTTLESMKKKEFTPRLLHTVRDWILQTCDK